MSPMVRKSVDIVNNKEQVGPDNVLDLIHHVMHQVRSQQYQVLRDSPHEVTHMESKVLGFFDRHSGATQSDLVQHSGRDKAQLARLIKSLRERGLLDAETDAADRRNLHLSLSAQGRAVQVALLQQAERVATQALAGLSLAEQQQLAHLLRRIGSNLDQKCRDKAP